MSLLSTDRSCESCKISYHPSGTKQKRCDLCRFVNVICLECSTEFRALFRRHRTKKLCSLQCSRRYTVKIRKNPPRSEQARANMSAAQIRRYGLSDTERKARRKMRIAMNGLLQRCLFRGILKDGHSEEQLGYTRQDLRKRLEETWRHDMSWDNYGHHGEKVWNIDHVKPVSSFSLDTSPKIIHALSNLRALWSHENYVKGSRSL